MKKLILSTTTMMVLTGMLCFTNTAYSQSKSSPHRVGLVDMAYIFKNYDRFKDSLELLGKEMKVKDTEGKQMLEDIKAIGGQLQALKSSSPDYAAKEKELASASSDLAAFRKVAEREFMRKQSKIYKAIYIEVKEVIDLAAAQFHYDLILRFNRQDLNEAEDPKQILSGMNRQVVYHQKGNDITEKVLNALNSRYKKSSGSKTRTRSATGKKRSTKQ